MGASKQTAKASKATVDYDLLKYDIDKYLRTNGGEYWRELFIPLIQGVVTEQNQEWASTLGMAFDVRNLEGELWFDQYTLQFAQPINDTTLSGVHSVIAQALEEGWPTQTTQGHIEQLFTQWMTGGASAEDFAWFSQRLPPHRTEMIARTETMRASNAGAFEQFGSWGMGYKGWLASIDGRERASHRVATHTYDEGGSVGVIPVKEAFTVGGYKMLYPGDSSMGAPISEIANCRCTILPYKTLPAGQGATGGASRNIQQRIADMYQAHGAENVRDKIVDFEDNRWKVINQHLDKVEKVTEKIVGLSDQIVSLMAQMRALPSDSPELEALEARWDKLTQQRHKLMTQRGNIYKTLDELNNAAGADFLSYGKNPNVAYDIRSRALAANKQAFDKAGGFLAQVFDGSVYDDALFEIPTALTRKRRAFCEHDGTININKYSRAGSIVHESGHSIEDRNAAIHKLCVDFLQYRTAGETPVSMRTLARKGGHYAWETTRPDKFPSYYCGADYTDSKGNVYGTEILSMGLEYMLTRPAQFAKEDPEYFDFIVGVMRGWL